MFRALLSFLTPSKSTMKQAGAVALTGCGVVAALIGSLYMIQHKLIYIPRGYNSYPDYYASVRKRFSDMKTLSYKTSEGQQTAFYIPPATGKDIPSRVWVLHGGNAALALDWAQLVQQYERSGSGSERAGFLLVDYPGYGECKGTPSPNSVLEGTRQAVASLLKHQAELERSRWGVLGHSLGSAACLQFAASLFSPSLSQTASLPDTLWVDRVILLAPFTTLPAMARHLFFNLPIHHLVKHNFDNLWSLDTLITAIKNKEEEMKKTKAEDRMLEVTVMHGEEDEIVPVEMGRQLASHAQKLKKEHGLSGVRVAYLGLRGLNHNNIIDEASHLILQAMTGQLHSSSI